MLPESHASHAPQLQGLSFSLSEANSHKAVRLRTLLTALRSGLRAWRSSRIPMNSGSGAAKVRGNP